jgi:hypothetical protein
LQGGQSAQGAMLVFPLGVAVGILHYAWCSPVWSAECLPSRFGAGFWQWWEPSCFLSVMWCGEAFYRLGVQGVKVLILLGALFLPSVASGLSKIFDSRSSSCLLLCPSCHLGSSTHGHFNKQLLADLVLWGSLHL